MCYNQTKKVFLKIVGWVLLCGCCQSAYSACPNLDKTLPPNGYGCAKAALSEAVTPQKNPELEAQLFVFVSNSMPEQSLQQWAQQVEKLGGTLVLRGFIDNSPIGTVERVKTLFGERNASGFSIDPERFEQLGIDKVPAVAVVLGEPKRCEQEECPKPVFGVVYGDVPLEEALSLIAIRNPGEVRAAARQFLVRYREGEK